MRHMFDEEYIWGALLVKVHVVIDDDGVDCCEIKAKWLDRPGRPPRAVRDAIVSDFQENDAVIEWVKGEAAASAERADEDDAEEAAEFARDGVESDKINRWSGKGV